MEAKAAAGFAVKGLSVKADPETGRSVLYIDGAKADATTLPHELMHKYREFASPDMVNRLSAALGLRDSSDGAWLEEAFDDRTGKRKINAHEKLAEYWEDYLAGGDNAAIPEEVKGFFKRLAEAVAKIFEAMGWKRQEIPAELRGIFDEIAGGKAKAAGESGVAAVKNALAGADSGMDGAAARLEAFADMENALVLYSGQKGTVPTREQIAEAKRQYKAVKERCEGTDLWLKSPNGKDTKLTERQWIQVRTPLFKKYFGDWEAASLQRAKDLRNSADTVSVVRDAETGEPLVAYHAGTFDSRGDEVREGMHFGTVEAARARAHTAVADHAVRDMEIKKDEGGWYWDSGDYPPYDEEARYATEKEAREAGAEEIIESVREEDPFGLQLDIEYEDFTAAFLNIRNPLYAEDAGKDWRTVIDKAKAVVFFGDGGRG
jgi:hypothetical protein